MASSTSVGGASDEVRAGTAPPAREFAEPVSTAGGQSSRCLEAETGEVVIWDVISGGVAGQMFDRFLTEFSQVEPGISVNRIMIEGGTEGMLEQLANTNPDQWPDLIVAQPQALRRLVDTGKIVPPAKCSDDLPAVLPVVEAAYTFDGSMYALPFGVSTPVLLFDAAEYRAAGLDPSDPPRTLEELSAASRTVVERGASPFGVVAYDWFGTFLVNQGAAQRREFVAFPDNGRERGPMTVDYDVEANRAALQWLLDLVDGDGGVYIGGIPSGLENLLRIVDETAGGTMTIQTSGSLGDVIGFLESGSFDGVELGVGPMPGPGPGGLVGGNGLWLVDHGDPARVGRAHLLAAWLTSVERAAELSAATGYVPTSLAVAEHPVVVARWARYPQLKVAYDQLVTADGTSAGAGAVFGPSIEVDYAFYRMTSRVIDGRIPIDVALDELTSDVQSLLDGYDRLLADQSP